MARICLAGKTPARFVSNFCPEQDGRLPSGGLVTDRILDGDLSIRDPSRNSMGARWRWNVFPDRDSRL